MSLQFFPSWLNGFRALVSFFRSNILVDALCKRIEDNGYIVISSMIKNVSMPSIAEWRWGTLRAACLAIDGVLETIREHFDHRQFKNAKDPITMKKAADSLASPSWMSDFKFVLWFTQWICEIQSWGKGCSQQEAAKAEGHTHYDHMHNGRRLPEAEMYVDSKLNAGLQASNLWNLSLFGGISQEKLSMLQVCVRGTFVLAKIRHQHLSTVPWLLAMLLQPGVKQRCIDLYNANTQHEPLTHMFLHPDGELRAHVDALAPDGSGASELLAQEVKGPGNIPFDDSIAEGPHAKGNSIGRQAKGCGFPWVASTMRLGQNLRDARRWSKAMNIDLQTQWMKHKSVLQTDFANAAKLDRNVKMSAIEFRKRLYHVGALSNALPDLELDVDEQPRQHDEGHEPQLAEMEGAQVGDIGAVDMNDDAAGNLPETDDVSLVLMREYLIASLKPGMHISFPHADPVTGEVAPFLHKFWQLNSKSHACKHAYPSSIAKIF